MVKEPILFATHNKNIKNVISFFITSILLLSLMTTNSSHINNNNNIIHFAQAKVVSKAISSPSSSNGSSMSLILSNSTNYYKKYNGSGSSEQIKKQNQENITPHQQQQQSTKPKTREYTLIAEDTTLEIAPGIRVDAWTYNGTIPGPTLTATEGDRVIVHFINKTPLPHTVHFHGDHPGKEDGVFEQVQPNGTYTYDFIAEPAGALMYHCHVSPVMQHVRMGLYGAFIVYPKTPLPPAREYVTCRWRIRYPKPIKSITRILFF